MTKPLVLTMAGSESHYTLWPITFSSCDTLELSVILEKLWNFCPFVIEVIPDNLYKHYTV